MGVYPDFRFNYSKAPLTHDELHIDLAVQKTYSLRPIRYGIPGAFIWHSVAGVIFVTKT